MDAPIKADPYYSRTTNPLIRARPAPSYPQLIYTVLRQAYPEYLTAREIVRAVEMLDSSAAPNSVAASLVPMLHAGKITRKGDPPAVPWMYRLARYTAARDPMTLEEFTAMYEGAARLERAGDHTSARDAFLVVSDAAEEMGVMDDVREARRRAMTNHVTAWARQRWPAERIHIFDVTFSQFPFGTFGRRRSRVDMQIRRSTTAAHVTVGRRTVTHVTVGRRGDVRLEHDGAP